MVVAPCPLLPLEKEGPGSRGLLVGVGVLGVGGFGHLHLLAHISHSVLGVVASKGGGGISCQVKFAVVKFAAANLPEAPGFCVANFADTPRNVVVCRALQARWSSVTGANFVEDPGFSVGNFAAQHEVDCPRDPPPLHSAPPPAVARR